MVEGGESDVDELLNMLDEETIDVKSEAKVSDPRAEVFTSFLRPAPKKARLDHDGVTGRLAKATRTKRTGKSLVWSISPKGFSVYDDIQHKQYMVCNACVDAGNLRIAEFNAGGGSTSNPKNHLQRHHKPFYDQLLLSLLPVPRACGALE